MRKERERANGNTPWLHGSSHKRDIKESCTCEVLSLLHTFPSSYHHLPSLLLRTIPFQSRRKEWSAYMRTYWLWWSSLPYYLKVSTPYDAILKQRLAVSIMPSKDPMGLLAMVWISFAKNLNSVPDLVKDPPRLANVNLCQTRIASRLVQKELIVASSICNPVSGEHPLHKPWLDLILLVKLLTLDVLRYSKALIPRIAASTIQITTYSQSTIVLLGKSAVGPSRK